MAYGVYGADVEPMVREVLNDPAAPPRLFHGDEDVSDAFAATWRAADGEWLFTAHRDVDLDAAVHSTRDIRVSLGQARSLKYTELRITW